MTHHRKQRAAHPPALDVERAAQAQRAQRAAQCEAELQAILARHACALQVIQVYTNGQPGPIQVRVIPLAEAPPDSP